MVGIAKTISVQLEPNRRDAHGMAHNCREDRLQGNGGPAFLFRAQTRNTLVLARTRSDNIEISRS
jgi:hypothetical protein